jgi:multidrug efflux pump subunit AcrB
VKTIPYTYQKNAFAILATFVCLVMIGIGCMRYLHIQLNPSRTSSQLRIEYYCGQASPRIVEAEVTSKLEGLCNRVKGIASIKSGSSKGYGYILIELKKNVSTDVVRFELANLIRQTYPDLPDYVTYPTISQGNQSYTPPLVVYKINAPATPQFIQQYAEENFIPAISKVAGVKKIDVYGATPLQWELTYRPDQLRMLGLSSYDLRNAIQQYINPLPLGAVEINIDDNARNIDVVLTQSDSDTLQWNEIPVTFRDNRLVFLTDVVTIRHVEQPVNSYFRMNGLNVINMIIQADQGVNQLEVSNQIKETVSQLQKSLPPNYSLLLAHDESEYIKNELTTISYRFALSLGILLVFIVLVSRQLLYVILLALSIIVNLLLACIIYQVVDLEIHIYTLAGITISMGLLIDNTIVMIDHLRIKGDKKVWLAIVAATLTTVGALSIIFLLKEEQQLNLFEFAYAITINLLISLVVSLYFIPACMEYVRLTQKRGRVFIRRKRWVLFWAKLYEKVIQKGKRYRWVYFIVFILMFGIPLHLLPTNLEDGNIFKPIHQKTIGSKWFAETVRPWSELLLGGSFRLFHKHSFSRYSNSEPGRTTLNIRGAMPEGGTIEQLNDVISRMEIFISSFDQVESFQTNIYNYKNGSITVHFKKEHEASSFPYYFKNEIDSYALQLGGIEWNIYGVGQGFSNSLNTQAGSQNILVRGYQYEQLHVYANALRDHLLQNPRIKEVYITSSPHYWYLGIRDEYYLQFKTEPMAVYNLNPSDVSNFIQNQTQSQYAGRILSQGTYQNIVLQSNSYKTFDVWNLNHTHIHKNDNTYAFSSIGSIDKRKESMEIAKENQQYMLYVRYDFIGSWELANKVRGNAIDVIKDNMPLGFDVVDNSYYNPWSKEEPTQYYLIFLVILIIFFICSILFDSLRQPFAIIWLIPISFIGIFLTFYLFEIPFDQGGYASFVMVAALVVNSGIYIINDYNNLRKTSNAPLLKLYIKAFMHKLTPILLTILSTVLGLIPFLWISSGTFWLSFAAGTMGGLMFSLFAVILYLPLFIRIQPSSKRLQKNINRESGRMLNQENEL